ncbi:sirohydrochlorin chelatase [Marinobacter sp. X15-166B]|uniref:sirohydrochlorin chelatase n=1 Tax=Marinobacter sp. X15-166B TaxID=1897620 RepID=UPI00085C333D|nr:CbiX/SirB N-terminal domain-containing protein [Marinobacter sp. X15-166B]OEY67384.1 cobalamin biosynthesis protein CbiX [Marinobacter sp. X15-166B]
MPSRSQVILLAHGSRDRRWCDTIECLSAQTLNAIPGAAVAYMELSTPSLEQVVTDAAAAGCEHVIVLPLFLAAGRHLRVDVPAQIASLQAQLNLRIELLPAVGENPVLGDAICEVARQSLERCHE